MKVLAAMLISVIMLSSGFFVNSPATAAPNENANDKANRTFSLPENAIQIAPGVFYLGSSIHDGKVVQGIAVLEHKPQHSPKGGGGNGGNGGDGGGDKCFTVISKGAKWKVSPEDWIVDGSNFAGLNPNFVDDNIAAAITEWEDFDDDGIDNFDILGDVVSGTVNRELIGDEANGVNEIMFADISNPGVIAMNISWGIFFGNPSNRVIVEWDQVYNDNPSEFGWSYNGESTKMDFLNIATHEVGHATGLSHPNDTCTEETMFAFSTVGETIRQTIESGDIAGIQELYG